MTTFAKRFGVWMLSAVTLAAAALVWLAYGYTPPAASEPSRFLKDLGAQRVETPHYVFNSVKVGAGSPIVLIHGAGTWLYSFRENLAALAATHTVYAFDMPGHGYTTEKLQPERYDLPLMAGAIGEYLDSQHLDKVDLAGHSFGGGWALYFAEQHPERVKKLVLLAPRAVDLPYKLEWEVMKSPLVGELISKLFSKDDTRRLLRDSYFDTSLVTDEVLQNVFVPLTFAENRRAFYHLVRDSDWRPAMTGMKTLPVPTLLLWGREDQFVPLGQMDLFRSIPQLQTQVLDDCGHSLQEEKPRQVNALMNAFFSE